MEIALIGASGNAGSRILSELVSRGHHVTAIARHPDKIAKLSGVTAVEGDVYDKAQLVALIKGYDVLISSVHFSASDPDILISAAHEAGVKRYLVVGGAGSLLTPDGKKLIESPHFPDIYKVEAAAGGVFLDKLRAQSAVNWTYFSPPAVFIPGARTGIFRLGLENLIADTSGTSTVSMEDFAIAMVDEIEKPAHLNQRFTIGY